VIATRGNRPHPDVLCDNNDRASDQQHSGGKNDRFAQMLCKAQQEVDFSK
jgi:hypothetical protein